MLLSSKVPAPILEALGKGWTVVTGNQRAARTLRQVFNANRQAQGAAGWEPPAVFAWDTWLTLLWRRRLVEGRASALLLTAHQEHAVWRQIVSADEELGLTLRSPDSLADLAAGAWELLNRFGARRELRRYADTADTRAFARWVAEFERRTAREVLLSRARLPEVLSEAFAKGELAQENLRGILLTGFDQRSPDQAGLLDAMVRAGVPIDELTAAAADTVGKLAGAASEQAELEGCARWIRHFLKQTPEAQVAVIVPGLEELRSRIERTFREIVAPELEDIADGGNGAPWEFSLGVPLASTALAGAALDLLEWAVGPLPAERASRLLLSPYFAGGDARGRAGGGEYLARAEFDGFVLRKKNGLLPEVTLPELLRLVEGSLERDRLPELLRCGYQARKLLERLKPAEGERSHAAWCAVFQQVLEAWGWSDGRLAGSVEFQMRRRWSAVLDELSSLDFDGRAVGYSEALKELRRIAGGTLFAPESREAPVQVMGPLEAAGSRFDAIWFLRAGDLSWPKAASAHPLLPLRLQREKGMPGTDPSREMELARTMVERVESSAHQVFFSYAREAGDGHQRPSPALNRSRLETVRLEDLVETLPARMPVVLEKKADSEAIPELRDERVRGGSKILELQAACGFRAFAEKRLRSDGLETASAGLDSMKRGNLVHTVLETVWKELGTQAALKALGERQRQELLARSIDAAMERERREGAGAWPTAYLDTERERLLRLLGLWLQREAERPPFVVGFREERVEDVAIGPLRVEVRLDRIDVLLKNGEPAGEIVLDYKTGSVKPADWMGERPDDPQVPLYALVRRPEELVGVAFGSVRPGKGMSISGLQSETGVLPGKGRPVDLHAQVEDWRRVLSALAEEYAAGNATVSPKQYPSTCRYCEQRLLCRLDPKTLEPENLEDLADPDYETEAEVG